MDRDPRTRHGFGSLLFVTALAASLALSGTGATSLVRADSSASAHASPSTLLPLPSALSTSWGARAGYDPVRLAALSQPVRATGTLQVVLTLWPSDLGLFRPATVGSRPLTDQEFQARFSPSPASYHALESYFAARGLTVLHAWQDRLALTIEGPAAAVAGAFGTVELSGTWDGRHVELPATEPRLPGSFQSEVAAVTGLETGVSKFSFPFTPLPPPKSVAASGAPLQGRTTTLVTPNAAHVIYDLDGLYNFSGGPHWATGEGIVLLLWGWGYDPNDISTFFSNYFPAGFPQPSWTPYPIDGAPNPSGNAITDPSGGPEELTLDLEWAGAAAPGAQLDAVYAPDGPASNNYSPTDATMEDALNFAVNSLSGVRAISMSFGTPDGPDASFQAAFSVAFHQATVKGITLLAASGDNGGVSAANCGGSLDPQFPAASPQVIGVGGTAPVLALSPIGAVTGIDSEPAWNLSGGGFSTDYPAPSWQVGAGGAPLSPNGMRGIPDVSAAAFNDFLYFGGLERHGRGTSFATPLWAGLIAEMDAIHGTPLGFLTPRLYAVGQGESAGTTAIGLVDVTTGSNCVTSASAGWDSVTGWGTPRGALLYQDLSSTYVNVTLAANPTSVAPGGSVVATVSVVNASSGRPIANLPVNVTLTSPGYVGPCGGTLNRVSTTTDPNGTASVPISVPSCYLGSHASLTASVLANGYFGFNTTTVQVNLLGLAGFLAFIQQFPYNVIAFVLIMLAAIAIGLRLGNRRRRGRSAGAPTRPGAPSLPRSIPPPAGTRTPPSPEPPPPPATSGAGPPVAQNLKDSSFDSPAKIAASSSAAELLPRRETSGEVAVPPVGSASKVEPIPLPPVPAAPSREAPEGTATPRGVTGPTSKIPAELSSVPPSTGKPIGPTPTARPVSKSVASGATSEAPATLPPSVAKRGASSRGIPARPTTKAGAAPKPASRDARPKPSARGRAVRTPAPATSSRRPAPTATPEPKMLCPECMIAVPIDSTRCPSCGTPLS